MFGIGLGIIVLGLSFSLDQTFGIGHEARISVSTSSLGLETSVCVLEVWFRLASLVARDIGQHPRGVDAV